MTTTIETTRPIAALDRDLLGRCRSRAGAHDRDNTFPHEDLAELKAAGYLTAAVPTDLGGWGDDLATLARRQRELARHAPATALALSMHHYFVGTAADLRRFGDDSLEWILRDAVAGEVFAAGHAEAGNDVPVALSTTRATRVEGGYVLHGRKQFGSLSPVWTRFGVHALDADAPGGPAVVHGWLDRDAPGLSIVETWDALGMRATQSHDTVLDGVFLPDARVGASVPAGETAHPFTGTMLVWALSLLANVYTGIAERAFELAIASARMRTSIALARDTMATNPMVQHRVAEMYLVLDALRAQVDRLTADWVDGVDHGPAWAVQVLSAKRNATEGAKRVVDVALDVAGGGSLRRGGELERLYRDVRCGGFHPGTESFAHEVIGKAMLGVEPQPRW
jgi:alkylation response protein AidB-like acyl-CoA dehydrogenase